MQEYNKTDQQIHWLSQIIAKVNRAFVPEKADDSHTNLYFDPVSERLFGRWIETGNGDFLLSLNLKEFAFEWLDKQIKVLQTVQTGNRTLSQIEKAVAAWPAGSGLDAKAIFRELHFQIPDYQINSIRKEHISKTGLAEWLDFRDLANISCQRILGLLQAKSEIRIWPHHFDTGVYAQVNSGFGIGFGLAMQDKLVNAPYFYLAGYANDREINYTNLPEIQPGYWETKGPWKGAVLPLTQIARNNRNEAISRISDFIVVATGWYLEQTFKS